MKIARKTWQMFVSRENSTRIYHDALTDVIYSYGCLSLQPDQCQKPARSKYRKHNYDECRWRDVTVYEPRPEVILVRYRDQKEHAPPPRTRTSSPRELYTDTCKPEKIRQVE